MNEVVDKWYHISENLSTFLSDGVRELVREKGIASTSDVTLNLFNDPLDIDTNLSSLLLKDEGYLLHPTQRSENWYCQHIQNVAPLFGLIEEKIETSFQEEIQSLIQLCAWMQQNEVVSLCFSLLQTRKFEKKAIKSHECLLLITAALERALGNLFLHGNRKRKVPSLLRDLLSSPELSLLLGEPKVILLQLLLGSPMSLNLRNLIWHGFVGVMELDSHRYASVLLFICAAIGRHLDLCRSITVNEITPRCWATFKALPKWSEFFNEAMLVEAVSRTRGLPASRKAIWHQAIMHHQKGCYGRCCALILPEIEHTLRLIYCAANDCPSRSLTAESVVHYTTLDVILECDESNRIIDFLGDNLYWALLDVFVESQGPRIRDRFSHGECRLLDIDVDVSRHLLALSTALLSLADTERPSIPPYLPHYSATVVFHRELITTIEAVGEWLHFVNNNDNNIDCDNQFNSSSCVIDLSAWPSESVALLSDWLENWSMPVNHLLINHLKDNNRSKDNGPLAATWRHMMSQLVSGCQRMTSYRSTLSSLRSRQRSTQARLDSYMSLFVRAVQLSLFFPTAVCLGGNVVDDPQSKSVRRVKRTVTRWADNFALCPTNNRWIELAACARGLLLLFQSTQAQPIVFHR